MKLLVHGKKTREWSFPQVSHKNPRPLALPGSSSLLAGVEWGRGLQKGLISISKWAQAGRGCKFSDGAGGQGHCA